MSDNGRILGAFSIAEIAGANKTLIYNQRQALRKAGKKLPDARVYSGGKPKALRPTSTFTAATRIGRRRNESASTSACDSSATN